MYKSARAERGHLQEWASHLRNYDRKMTPQARNQAIAESDPGRRTAVDFLRLAERKWLILGVVLACIAASLAISLTSEKEYQAESELLLRDPGFARTLFGSDLFEGGVDPERVTSTKIAVIGSPAVTQRVQEVISERFRGPTSRAASTSRRTRTRTW